MTISGEDRSAVRNLVEMLRAELAWYPGRTALVGRTVLACTSVMVLAEVFRIPGAVLGASFPILISRESPAATRKSAFQIASACSMGTAELIIGGMLTAGSPFLHVLWVLATLIAAFYVMSSLNFISPALTVGALIAIGIQEWDRPVSAEMRVEHTLYTLLAILMGCLITALIDTLFGKKDSPDAILDGINRRLGLLEALLSQARAQDFPPSALAIQLSRSATQDVDDLSGLLARSHHEPGFHDLLATVIALTRQLVQLGSSLAESPEALNSEDQERCLAIARNLSLIRSCLLCTNIAGWTDLSLASNIANPILVEIERTLDLMVQSFSNHRLLIHQLSPEATPQPAIGVFAFSTLRNNEHFKFAVRGALPAFLCYLFHLSTSWMGLAASILTCVLTARPFTGASRQRRGLRFAGFIVGAGVIGWATEVFVLPQLDSLAQYALLFASVVWIGSWVATSGPRISFSGFQIVIAYNLVSLNRFTINTSLLPSRDAVLSILLGVVAMRLIFDHLWAEDSGPSTLSLLLATLRSLAHFEPVTAVDPQEANQRLVATSSKVNRDFDKLRDLSDIYAFESFPRKPHEILVNRSIRTLKSELRAFLLVKTGLLQHRILIAAVPDALIEEVEEQASSVLLGLAKAIEIGSPLQLPSPGPHADALRVRVQIEEEKSADRRNRQKYIEMRLCRSLLDLTGHLERRAQLNFVPETEDVRAFSN